MIDYIATNDKATLFWDKHSDFKDGCVYKVYKNNKEVEKLNKTHITIKNLTENTDYTFCVELVDDCGKVLNRDEISFKTGKTKRKIDVTLPPYNAVGDGKTLNTKQIQSAIDACGADEYVYFPKGDFLTGALRLRSDMELYIDNDAVLHGTSNVCDYEPKIHSRFEGIEMMCYSSLLNMGELNSNESYNCKNVLIHGGGKITGGGSLLARNVIEKEKIVLKEYIASLGDKVLEYECADTIPGRVRPRLINISNSQNIILEDLTIENGPSWNVHMIYSDNVITHNCVFKSEGIFNGDGWDPDSSTNCTIFNCEFYTGDDSVAIKSGKNPEGNIINRPSEHIRIFDCICHSGHGITIGSEMSGGINDIKIWDCDLANSVYGIEIKATKKRGGYVRNVNVKDCVVSRILMHSVGYNDDGEAASEMPVFEDCTFENLSILGIEHSKNGNVPCDAIELSGFDKKEHYIKNVKFKDISLSSAQNTSCQKISFSCCDGVSFENICCH